MAQPIAIRTATSCNLAQIYAAATHIIQVGRVTVVQPFRSMNFLAAAYGGPMSTLRCLVASLLFALLTAGVCGAQDFSSYRGFRLGSNPEVVGKNIGGATYRLKVIHERPALIEDFEWNPSRTGAAPATGDSLRSVRFSFYNQELFRIVVTYDPAKTEGLTTDDIIEAIAKDYGPPSMPDAMVIISPLGTSYPDSEKILAAWENTKYSYTLFRSSFGSTFGLVIVSKERESLAKVASEQSIAQEQLAAPQKELDRQKQQDNERREAAAKAREINKPKFRP